MKNDNLRADRCVLRALFPSGHSIRLASYSGYDCRSWMEGVCEALQVSGTWLRSRASRDGRRGRQDSDGGSLPRLVRRPKVNELNGRRHLHGESPSAPIDRIETPIICVWQRARGPAGTCVQIAFRPLRDSLLLALSQTPTHSSPRPLGSFLNASAGGGDIALSTHPAADDRLCIMPSSDAISSTVPRARIVREALASRAARGHARQLCPRRTRV